MAKEREPKRRKPPTRGAASPTSQFRLAAFEKQKQALDLRLAGANYDQIAETVGYKNKGGAHKAVKAALTKTLQEPAEEVRKIELERLNRLWLALWPSALKGDVKAIRECVALLKRRADFLGLDAAKDLRLKGQLEHTGAEGKPIQVKSEHNIDPREFASVFREFFASVFDEGVATFREDGSIEPVDSTPAAPETNLVPPA